VVQREFRWDATPDAERSAVEPLTRLWDFEVDDHAWQVPLRSGSGFTRDGVLRASGVPGHVDLVGPGPNEVQPELHHWLTLRLRTTSARTLKVYWRSPGESFSPHRSTSAMRLDHSGEWAVYSIAMAGLRGVREHADAAEGVEAFRLRFGGPDQQTIEVEIDRIVLVSDHDDLEGRGYTEGRLTRGGVARQGLALRVPGSVTTSLPAGAPDRLRLALAVVGTPAPVTVVVADLENRIQPVRITLSQEQGWHETVLELPARDEPLQLTVSAAGQGAARAVVLIGSVMRLAPAPRPKPSVILYVEDTLRADRLSTYGYARPTDPFLSGLAEQGVVFTRTWSTSNWTRPSISSLLTSLDPVAHGNQVHTRRVPESLTTLAETLAEAGWITASFVTNYHAGSWAGLDQGFDLNAEPWAYGATRLTSTLTSGVLTDPMAAFLAEHADEQVLIFAHSLDPHAPYEPEVRDLAALARSGAAPQAPDHVSDAARWKQAGRDYDAEVLHNDHELAALDAALARLGLADHTIFVFASDHGEAFGEHQHWEHRKDLHEEQVRVPWIMRWPGRLAAGRRIESPASLLDLAPTLLGLLDLSPPAAWQGRDLSSLSRKGPAGLARPAPLFLDAVYDEPRAGGQHDVAVVSWPYKLIAAVGEDGEPRPIALFDLEADPHERGSLLDAPEHAGALTGLMDIARARLGAGPLAPNAGADATPMDPAVLEWMKQMGYLR
jgi:arylsulfatase A-like enzyme